MAENFRSLLYRYGFAAWRLDRSPRHADIFESGDFAAWGLHRIGDIVFRTHPEVALRQYSEGSRTVVVLGDIFPATASVYVDHILREICIASDDVALEKLSWLSGRFALVLIDPEGAVAVHDAFGARTIFYSCSNPGVIASHAELLARLVGAMPDAAMKELMTLEEYKGRTVKYLPGDRTLWEDVLALVPNNALRIETSRTHRYWPKKDLARADFEDFYGELKSYYDELASFLSSSWKPVLGITGGIDTRSIFAALDARKVRFSGVTWKGGYIEEKEIPVVDDLVRIMMIEHRFIDFQTERYDQRYVEISKHNSGGFRGGSKLTACMAAVFRELCGGIFVRGYGGEIIRGFYNLGRKPLAGFEVEDLVRGYGSSMKNKGASARYLEIVGDAFEGFRRRANYDVLKELKGWPPSDLFYWEHRMGMWGATMLNEMDAAMYSIVGMNSRRLYEVAFGLDDEIRLTKSLFQRAIERMSPRIAEVKYF